MSVSFCLGCLCKLPKGSWTIIRCFAGFYFVTSLLQLTQMSLHKFFPGKYKIVGLLQKLLT